MKGEKRLLTAQQLEQHNSYDALKQALAAPEAALEQIKASGLQGRSGSGFPTGVKWAMVKNATAKQKYIICNADEGEPGTCKDRLLLTRTPQAVLEGILIGAVCTGASKGYLYIRGEYQDAIEGMRTEIASAYSAGLLGKSVLGSGFSFYLELHCGSGSYLCGEETALLESIEGRRGEVRQKPPYPGVSGLWGCPTLINNVETFANIPVILRMGAAEYRRYGTEHCPGTKLVTVSGCVNAPGVYEVEIGTSIRMILMLAGGCREGVSLRAVQTGGGSGPILPAEQVLDIPFDMEHCAKAGAFFGTGDLLFLSSEDDLAALCRNLTEFFAEESCGRCAPCRIGLNTICGQLDRFQNGTAEQENPQVLGQLASDVKAAARCALGAAAVGPVLSVLQNFPEVFSKSGHGKGM